MNKKFCTAIICLIFILTFLIFARQDKSYRVKEVISPVKIVTDKGIFELSEFDCFDSQFTSKNKKLANVLKITEEYAFLLGNLGKSWAENLLKSRFVNLDKSDLIYQRLSYSERFKYSGFCLKDGAPCYKSGFEKKLQEIHQNSFI